MKLLFFCAMPSNWLVSQSVKKKYVACALYSVEFKVYRGQCIFCSGPVLIAIITFDYFISIVSQARKRRGNLQLLKGRFSIRTIMSQFKSLCVVMNLVSLL